MLKTGLVSVTFRSLEPKEIVGLVSKAGLEGIEWGGDIHCPPGLTDKAAEVRTLTEDAGLQVAAYGSYFRPGENDPTEFGAVMATALALKAPTIRVWAGKLGSAKASLEYRQKVIEDTRKISEMAAAEGLTVAYEYHQNTLTDTNESAQATVKEVDHEAFRLYWQPIGPSDLRLAGLEAIVPKLSNFHVYCIDPDKGRMPLAAGEEDWLRYFATVSGAEKAHWAMLEFVEKDDPEAFLRDAATLKMLVKKALVLGRG